MAEQYAELDGTRVTSARVTIPMQGAWVADVVLAVPKTIGTGLLTLKLGDLTLRGTARRTGDFAGERSARIVGGYGGWRKDLPPNGYANINGVRLKTVLDDVVRESGESLAPFDDRVLGTNWVREQGPAERTLRLLAPRWWIDNDGKTHIEERSQSAIASAFTLVHWSAGKGLFEIATEKLSDWTPGRTFTAPTMPQARRINSVSITSDNDGKLRLMVLSGAASANKMLDDVRSIVRDETAALTYAGVWEYTVKAVDGQLVDATPVAIGRLPEITKVNPFPGGAFIPPKINDRVMVLFLNQDPSSPRWMGTTGTEHLMTVEATVVLLHNVLFGVAAAEPTGLPGLQPLIAGIINAALTASSAPAPPGLIAQEAVAPALGAAMAAGAAGNTAFSYASAIASALAGKTSDVSGLFPSVGAPVSDG